VVRAVFADGVHLTHTSRPEQLNSRWLAQHATDKAFRRRCTSTRTPTMRHFTIHCAGNGRIYKCNPSKCHDNDSTTPLLLVLLSSCYLAKQGIKPPLHAANQLENPRVSSNKISLLTVSVNSRNNSKTSSKQQKEKTDRGETLLEPTVSTGGR
jgi:hypothetical protein